MPDANPLEDFPLQGEGSMDPLPFPAVEPEAEPSAPTRPRAAALSARLSAAAADAAAGLLLGALAILAAKVVTGLSPRPAGIPWAIGFLLYLSLFSTVPALVLFGRTVGMALSDMTARTGDGRAGLPVDAALRRWAGTLATAASAGLLLLWTARDPEMPTPADRLSGRPLTLD
jgi:uncharacterized RDD family membrane protein YckC